jgi:GTP-binding protein EngB required for normal cell division
MVSNSVKQILLVGNMGVGKSTVYNTMTGQKTEVSAGA